ncbi:MAG: pitrilysin family protein [Acidimicrobiales bacterium]
MTTKSRPKSRPKASPAAGSPRQPTPGSGSPPAVAVRLPVPGVGKPRPVKLPAVTDHTLANGLRVLVARRTGIPRFEARLVVPIARRTDTGDPARLRLLTQTVLSGTADRTSRDIAERFQAMGAGLGSFADAEQLVVGGSSLSAFRGPFLDLFGELVAQASFPADEVAIERDHLGHEIAVLRSQAGVVAGDALLRRLYGNHPYGHGTPEPEAVAKVRAGVLRKLHAERVGPNGSLLVLVGDLDLDKTITDVDAAFGGWAKGDGNTALPTPSASPPGPAVLLDRPGAVQTTVRIAGPAILRSDPEFPALMLAVTVFGGSFTSRLNDNIRERKGFTYGAHARIEQRRAAAQLTVSADVGRDVTAAALVETFYELGRMVSAPVEEAELVAARRYLQGTMAMGIQTQAGLTAYLSTIVASGLDVGYLRDYPKRLELVTAADVLAASRAYLAPRNLTTVLVGDAATVEPTIAPLMAIERG